MGKYTGEMSQAEREFAAINEMAEANRLRRVAIDLELIKLIDKDQLATFPYKNKDLA